MQRIRGVARLYLALVSSTAVACTGQVDDPGPAVGKAPGTSPATPADPGVAADPSGCSGPERRVWKLTPPQLQASLARLVTLPDVTPRLRSALSGALGGYSNEAARLEMSAPHLATLFDVAQEAAAAALATGGAAAPCLVAASVSDCAAGLLADFGARAFRRPLTSEETTRYGDFFARELAASDAATALGQLVSALLLSPHFQYRTELGTQANADFELSGHERAQILSYTLADAPPDPALEAAATGGLTTPDELKAHARRLLASPSTAPGLERFFSEHFYLGSVRDVTQRDEVLYPTFDSALTSDLSSESSAFVREVLWGDVEGKAKLPTLFAGGFSMLNERLASLYGVSGVVGPELRRTALPSSERAGLLTQGTFLARLANAQEGDLVKRGRFVREQLLCGTIPPPPANVNAVPPPPSAELTQRERLVRHSLDVSCAGCHQLMDPLGFAFLAYDAIGAYRTLDAGKPIDASGVFDDGSGLPSAYVGAVELSKLLANSAAVQNCFSTKLYRYVSGRAPESDQTCAVLEAGKRFQASQGDVLELALDLVVGQALAPRREVP